ncbi:MAG: hypothetical protein R6W31_18375 [Bacteroidales bacterium]
MDASYFKHLISTDHYSPADLDQVNDLCRNYPMFNLAHMLKVRIRESLGYEKEQELKVAAVYAADRKKLFRMVTGVPGPRMEDLKPPAQEPEEIIFFTETHPGVDVIIGQHAPYAGAQSAGNDLLELEDEPKISAETLIELVVKEEAEMEEPQTRMRDTPAMEDMDSIPEADSTEEIPLANRLILNFLREDPGPIRANKFTASNRDVSLASIREHDGFITDTLAKIYVKQGLYAKAIYAYEKLSLKYPEKSAYFAAQIEKISNINHS